MDHIGIDVHKRERQICIRAEGGELIEQPPRCAPGSRQRHGVHFAYAPESGDDVWRGNSAVGRSPRGILFCSAMAPLAWARVRQLRKGTMSSRRVRGRHGSRVERGLT